jgi:hypothetical protein
VLEHLDSKKQLYLQGRGSNHSEVQACF